MSLKKIKAATISGGRVTVWYDNDLEEYQVQVRRQGIPCCTYHTTDRKDAIATAQAMCAGLPMEGAE